MGRIDANIEKTVSRRTDYKVGDVMVTVDTKDSKFDEMHLYWLDAHPDGKLVLRNYADAEDLLAAFITAMEEFGG